MTEIPDTSSQYHSFSLSGTQRSHSPNELPFQDPHEILPSHASLIQKHKSQYRPKGKFFKAVILKPAAVGNHGSGTTSNIQG